MFFLLYQEKKLVTHTNMQVGALIKVFHDPAAESAWLEKLQT